MSPRLILYTGKGGVGKSSLSAATAVETARRGQRTLLVSSDPAHNLGDILQRESHGKTVRLTDTLAVLEINGIQEVRDNWTPAQDYFAGLLEYLGIDDAVAEEVALLPGVEELFTLSRLLHEVNSDRYDVVVVDCAPTADTLRLLTFSDTACTKFRKLTQAKRRFFQLAKPFLRPIKAARPFLPDDDVFDVFDRLIADVGQLGEIFADTASSSIRLVLNPQRIAIAETRRTFTYFGLYGFGVDAVFINKVLPRELSDGYLNRWFSLEQDLLREIDRSFLDVAKFRVPLLAGEPIGTKALAEMAHQVFGDRAPDEVFSSSSTVSMTERDGKVLLSFPVAGIGKEDLDVGRKDDVLVVTAGPYTRVFTLPDTLVGRQVARASLEDELLTLVLQ
jgi:arsenite-transporting ATPase